MKPALCFLLLVFVIPTVPWPAFDPNPLPNVEAILQLHSRERDGHLKGDAGLIASVLGDNLTSVQNGTVETRTREEVRQRFAQYLAHVKYSAWEDVSPPTVHVSSDAKMAWAIITVKARLKDSDGAQPCNEEEFVSSWIATYERRGPDWRMVAISSGCEPPCGSRRASDTRD